MIGIEFRMQQSVDVEGAHQVSRSNAAIIEWFVVMCRYKNMHQNYMCSRDIGLRAHNLLIVL